MSVTLPSTTLVEYRIDGRNRRIGKVVDGVLVKGFLYKDEISVVAELDGTNTLVSRFVYGDRGHVPAYMVRGGVTYRIISDHVGSVRLVVDTTTGAVAQRLDYDAFGQVVQDTNPGFQPFGFAGGLYDPDTGLVRFGARDYDPRIGRWLSKDASGFGGGDVNLYGYAGGDPVGQIDPRGRRPYRSAWDSANQLNWHVYAENFYLTHAADATVSGNRALASEYHRRAREQHASVRRQMVDLHARMQREDEWYKPDGDSNERGERFRAEYDLWGNVFGCGSFEDLVKEYRREDIRVEREADEREEQARRRSRPAPPPPEEPEQNPESVISELAGIIVIA
jgi:RHS repeat-associated protein